eukprot:TRINITY_DN12473_c0_g1_i1.p1 TRINITY_DN12473_c0_g1~~TRINITY_DN12473_c0_g1_i1.p1  ORF type:complete len:399 (+),score=75.92 TRINITY_DN12473_c0_g1_i1:148-1197(+)
MDRIYDVLDHFGSEQVNKIYNDLKNDKEMIVIGLRPHFSPLEHAIKQLEPRHVAKLLEIEDIDINIMGRLGPPLFQIKTEEIYDLFSEHPDFNINITFQAPYHVAETYFQSLYKRIGCGKIIELDKIFIKIMDNEDLDLNSNMLPNTQCLPSDILYKYIERFQDLITPEFAYEQVSDICSMSPLEPNDSKYDHLKAYLPYLEADLINSNEDSKTPILLNMCLNFQHPDAISDLLEIKGVDVNITDRLGYTALMMANNSHSPNALDIIKLLVEYGADVNRLTNIRYSVLTYAATQYKIDTVEYLLSLDQIENTTVKLGYNKMIIKFSHSKIFKTVLRLLEDCIKERSKDT